MMQAFALCNFHRFFLLIGIQFSSLPSPFIFILWKSAITHGLLMQMLLALWYVYSW